MYADHPSNELNGGYIYVQTRYQAEDQVLTIIVNSRNMNDNIRSFEDRYCFLFSTDIAGYYTCVFSGNLGNPLHL